MRLGDLAAELGGVVEGDAGTLVKGVAGLEDAAPGDVVFVENARYAAVAAQSPAAAVIAPPGVAVPGKPVLRAEQPRVAFVRVLELFRPPERTPRGIAPTARLGLNATLGEGVALGEYCIVGDNAVLGDGVVLHPSVYLGDNVTVGAGTVLYPHVTVYDNCEIGARVRVHANTVIGADGFGYVFVEGRHRKIPHVGRVVIEDDVELGACVCVDRAKTAETRIAQGTKIDNLVQVAHNVHIGQHCAIAAQTGIAGTASLGDYVVVGGQVGIAPHTRVGSGTRSGAQAGLMGRIEPNSILSGSPAREHRAQLRVLASLGRLPDALNTIRDLLKRIEELERRLGEREDTDGRP